MKSNVVLLQREAWSLILLLLYKASQQDGILGNFFKQNLEAPFKKNLQVLVLLYNNQPQYISGLQW